MLRLNPSVDCYTIEDLNQVIKLNPNDPQLYYKRGVLRYELENILEAIEDFNQAIKFNPNYAEAYIYRAATYFNLGDKERAKQDLQKAAKFYQEQGNEQRQKEILQMIDKINSR